MLSQVTKRRLIMDQGLALFYSKNAQDSTPAWTKVLWGWSLHLLFMDTWVFIQVLHFPPTVQSHACHLNCPYMSYMSYRLHHVQRHVYPKEVFLVVYTDTTDTLVDSTYSTATDTTYSIDTLVVYPAKTERSLSETFRNQIFLGFNAHRV